MKKHLGKFCVLLVCVILLITACDLMGSEESEPTPTPTPAVTPTPLVTPASTPSPAVTPTPVPTPEPVDPYENILRNGDFSTGDDYWFTYDNSETGITDTPESGVMHITFSQAGSNPWECGFGQNNSVGTVEYGKLYHISFDAWGSNRTVRIQVQENNRDLNDDDNIHSTYCTFDSEVIVEQKSFNYLFIMNNPTDDNPEFMFQLGTNDSEVYFDNVIVKEVSNTVTNFTGFWVEEPSNSASDVMELASDGTLRMWDDYDCTQLGDTYAWTASVTELIVNVGLSSYYYPLSSIDADTFVFWDRDTGEQIIYHRKGTEVVGPEPTPTPTPIIISTGLSVELGGLSDFTMDGTILYNSTEGRLEITFGEQYDAWGRNFYDINRDLSAYSSLEVDAEIISADTNFSVFICNGDYDYSAPEVEQWALGLTGRNTMTIDLSSADISDVYQLGLKGNTENMVLYVYSITFVP